MTKVLFMAMMGTAVLVGPRLASATTVSFTPSKDNTLCQSSTGALSNALGDIYVGRVSRPTDNLRRGVLRFDVSSIPSTAVITSVTLSLYLARVSEGSDRTCQWHRLTSDWGEGSSFFDGGICDTSTTNDATWIHELYNSSSWSNPGGDFDPTVSASGACGLAVSTTYTWGSTSQLVSDVQSWVSGTATNYGWTMLGEENVSQTVRRYSSREATSNRPLLTVVYQ